MSTERPTQINPPPQEEFDEMILLSDHLRIVNDMKKEYEAKIEHMNVVNSKLESWGNGLQVKLNSLSQELYRLKSLVPDLDNIWKGLAKFGPNSFKTAMMLLAFLWAAHQTVFGMYAKANEKKKRPMWQWGMLFVFGAITFGVTLEAFQKPEAIGVAAPYLALIAMFGLIAFIVLRRKKQARAITP